MAERSTVTELIQQHLQQLFDAGASPPAGLAVCCGSGSEVAAAAALGAAAWAAATARCVLQA